MFDQTFEKKTKQEEFKLMQQEKLQTIVVTKDLVLFAYPTKNSHVYISWMFCNSIREKS